MMTFNCTDLVTSKTFDIQNTLEMQLFQKKNAPSEHNWTLSISGATVISDSYPIDRSMERYFRRLSVHFSALKMGRNNEVYTMGREER